MHGFDSCDSVMVGKNKKMNRDVTIGDLVRIVGASPYFGRWGLIVHTRQFSQEVYYHVLFSGSTKSVPFRLSLLRALEKDEK